MKIEKGQIYYVPFQFEDKPGFKPRPVIVLSVDYVNNFFLGVKVTTHAVRDIYDYPLKDWQTAGLAYPSTARCNKVQILPFSAIYHKIGLVGKVTFRDFREVRNYFYAFNHTLQHMINLPNQVVTERYNQDKYKSISANGFYKTTTNKILIDSMKKEEINFCYLKKGNIYKCVIDREDIQRFNNILFNLKQKRSR